MSKTPGNGMKWNLFISHASEDKAAFVGPLATLLQKYGMKVWYDEFSMKPGDSLSESVTDGLANSECGLLVISPAFMQRKWTAHELRAITTRYIAGDMELIPVWFNVSHEVVLAWNPAIADVSAIKTSGKSIEECAIAILQSVRPSLYEPLRLEESDAPISASKPKVKKVKTSNIEFGPIRHHTLPDSVLIRIQNIYVATRDALDMTLYQTISNFQRDLRPERELEIWERIVSAYHLTLDHIKSPNREVRKAAIGALIMISTGGVDQVATDVEKGKLSKDLFMILGQCWIDVVPKIKSEVSPEGKSADD